MQFATLTRALHFLIAYFNNVFTWKSTLVLSLTFTPSNLTSFSFKISVLEIDISMGVLKLAKRWHFLHSLPSDLPKTKEKFLLMLFLYCLSYFQYLKRVCKEYCHLHIQQVQLLFKSTCTDFQLLANFDQCSEML